MQMCACLKENMRGNPLCFALFAWFVRPALLAGIAKTATGKACKECKTLRQLEVVCVSMLGHKCSFPNCHFLNFRRKNWQKVFRHWWQNYRPSFPKLLTLPLSWVTFLLVTVLWIVWTFYCCFFADFLMVRALLVKIYQIQLLKEVWYVLIVLCTWFNSFSIQLETHHGNWNVNVWKRTEGEAGAVGK